MSEKITGLLQTIPLKEMDNYKNYVSNLEFEATNIWDLAKSN